MENALTIAAQKALPQLSANVTYNEAAKMFLTPGYVSAAGNMYQQGLRLSSRMAVKFDIGHGFCHSFLNGIQLYAWDAGKPKLVAHKCYNNFWWSEAGLTGALTNMVEEYLRNEFRVLGIRGNSPINLRELASGLIRETKETTELIGGQTISPSLCLRA